MSQTAKPIAATKPPAIEGNAFTLVLGANLSRNAKASVNRKSTQATRITGTPAMEERKKLLSAALIFASSTPTTGSDEAATPSSGQMISTLR